MKDLFKALNLTSDTGALITSPYNMQYFSGFSGRGWLCSHNPRARLYYGGFQVYWGGVGGGGRGLLGS